MTDCHFNSRSGLVRLVTLLLLMAALAGTAWLWAQNDSPITISDGSLTIDAAVPWSNFRGSGRNRTHPDGNRRVTQVAVTINGNNQTIGYSGEKCTFTFRYADTDFTVTTGNNGRGMQVSTNFDDFDGGNTNRLSHKNRNSRISHVHVTK